MLICECSIGCIDVGKNSEVNSIVIIVFRMIFLLCVIMVLKMVFGEVIVGKLMNVVV